MEIRACRILSVTQSCPALCDTMDCRPPGSSIHGIFQARILEWVQFSSVQSLSRVRLFATPWIVAHQASLSITNFQSLLKLMPIKLVMPSSHLILCRPLLLLPPIPPSIRIFSNESTLRMRWPKYWSFSFRISPSNEHPALISFRMDWLDLRSHSLFQGIFLTQGSNPGLLHFWVSFVMILKVFQSICSILCAHQQSRRLPAIPHAPDLGIVSV